MIIFLGNQDSTDRYSDLIQQSRSDRDIVVSCQYPFKVPSSLTRNFTCVNIHYGELPYYAGCNPIFWQIATNDHAGVTLHYMDDNFDSGDIIATDIVPTGNCTADQLYEYLANAGKELLIKHYEGILDGTAPRKKQDLSKRKYYSKYDVNFERMKRIPSMDDKMIRALHFEGKQHPIVKIGGNDYELRCCNTSL